MVFKSSKKLGHIMQHAISKCYTILDRTTIFFGSLLLSHNDIKNDLLYFHNSVCERFSAPWNTLS